MCSRVRHDPFGECSRAQRTEFEISLLFLGARGDMQGTAERGHKKRGSAPANSPGRSFAAQRLAAKDGDPLGAFG
jgi:hypothetical protein